MPSATGLPSFGSDAFKAAVRRASAGGPGWLERLPALIGTSAECQAGERARLELLERLGPKLDPWTLKAMLAVRSARWWLANRKACTPDGVAWPVEWFKPGPEAKVLEGTRARKPAAIPDPTKAFVA